MMQRRMTAARIPPVITTVPAVIRPAPHQLCKKVHSAEGPQRLHPSIMLRAPPACSNSPAGRRGHKRWGSVPHIKCGASPSPHQQQRQRDRGPRSWWGAAVTPHCRVPECPASFRDKFLGDFVVKSLIQHSEITPGGAPGTLWDASWPRVRKRPSPLHYLSGPKTGILGAPPSQQAASPELNSFPPSLGLS